MQRSAWVVLACLAGAPSLAVAAEPALSIAANAINALGIDLLTKEVPAKTNSLLSPYSIQTALAMTYVGAAGQTHDEMKATLHYAGDDAPLHASFIALQAALAAAMEASEADPYLHRAESDSSSTPLTFVVANRLFGQEAFEFRSAFLEFLDKRCGAPLQRMDFKRHGNESRKQINGWVANQTRKRILDLIPPDGIDDTTRLVLVNAIYMKASWLGGFDDTATRPRPFVLAAGETVDVPTMQGGGSFGYEQNEGYSLVRVPYAGGQVHLLILLPDDPNGLPALEAKLTPDLLLSASSVPESSLILYLPRFKLEPPLKQLGAALRKLGMRTAFDVPPGSANFDQMAPRRPDDYLCLSEVYHKTFLALDEHGTEAAAATAAVMVQITGIREAPPPPLEVKVDRPFLFAIQHRPSGACLFLGRVNDPRLQ